MRIKLLMSKIICLTFILSTTITVYGQNIVEFKHGKDSVKVFFDFGFNKADLQNREDNVGDNSGILFYKNKYKTSVLISITRDNNYYSPYVKPGFLASSYGKLDNSHFKNDEIYRQNYFRGDTLFNDIISIRNIASYGAQNCNLNLSILRFILWQEKVVYISFSDEVRVYNSINDLKTVGMNYLEKVHLQILK